MAEKCQCSPKRKMAEQCQFRKKRNGTWVPVPGNGFGFILVISALNEEDLKGYFDLTEATAGKARYHDCKYGKNQMRIVTTNSGQINAEPPITKPFEIEVVVFA